MRIGLLGGSFNPAHEGHLAISQHALKRLNLAQIWWLVSPQNPLKSTKDMASYDTRKASAQHFISKHPKLKLCEIETQRNLQFTRDTIAALQTHYPTHEFVWLMGADNLSQFHRWHQWRDIAKHVHIAVFDRAPHSHKALRSKAAIALKNSLPSIRTPQHAVRISYHFIPRHHQSSTALRNSLGKNAFVAYNKD